MIGTVDKNTMGRLRLQGSPPPQVKGLQSYQVPQEAQTGLPLGGETPPPPGPVLSSRKKTKPQEAVRAPFPLGTRSCAEGTCPGFCANAGRLLDGVPSQE